jgi:hypothetical protein
MSICKTTAAEVIAMKIVSFSSINLAGLEA